jgi:hypothetical protein
MKSQIRIWLAAALVPAALLSLASCCSAPVGEKGSMRVTKPGVPGGVAVDTYEVTATVTGIDAATRKVTLVSPDGKKTTYKAGPEVVNFPQIQIGDQVKVKAVESLVVFLKKKGEPSGDFAATGVAVAPEGAKPGAAMAETVEITAKVAALDLKRHKATLLFPDGVKQTVKVRKDVDLTKVNVGDEVVLRSTEALAILVEKP